MPRAAALRRLVAPLAAAAARASPGSGGAAAAGAAPALASGARRLSLAAAAPPHPWACGCGACAARARAPHAPGCACGACARSSFSISSPLATRQQQRLGAAPAFPSQRRGYRCCPGLDGAPPDKVVIEYDPEDVELYIQIADAIEEAFPNIVVDGNVDAEGRPGSFEITGATGSLLFSRLDSGGAAPQAAAIVAALAADGAAGAGECSVARRQE